MSKVKIMLNDGWHEVTVCGICYCYVSDLHAHIESAHE